MLTRGDTFECLGRTWTVDDVCEMSYKAHAGGSHGFVSFPMVRHQHGRANDPQPRANAATNKEARHHFRGIRFAVGIRRQLRAKRAQKAVDGDREAVVA